MKSIRVGLLAAALLIAGAGCAQDKVKSVGYDVGNCAPNGFVAAHIEFGENLVVTDVSTAPDEVKKLKEPLIYKFVKSDKEGKHYVNGQLDIIVSVADDKHFVAELVTPADGEIQSIIFGVPGDGSKLAENAKEEFGACLALFSEEDSKDSKI